jgi:hypothetical protein
MDSVLIKELLQDIERSNQLRKRFDLSRCCREKAHIYGDAGSLVRRSIQKKFNYIKNRQVPDYIKYLDKFEVAPGEGILRELRELKEETARNKETPATTEANLSESSYSSSDEEDITTSTKPTFKPVSASTSTKLKTFKPASPPPTASPAPTQQVDEVTVAFGKNKIETPSKMVFPPSITITSPSPHDSASDASVVVTDYVRTLEGMKPTGTIDFPYIVIVNLLKPEKNWGFEISEIENIVFRDYTRDGFHIRKTTTPLQADDWEATIPRQRYPSLDSRAVQIRGPSQDFWHQNPELYHEELYTQVEGATNNLPKDCSSTLNAHKKLYAAIQGDPTRKYSYWLLVFPESVVLENHIFSDDSSNVRKHIHPMEAQFMDDDEVTDINGVDVFWRIAVSGGDRLQVPTSARKKLFKSKKSKN